MEKGLKLEIQKYIQRSKEAIDTVKLLIQYKKYSDAVKKYFDIDNYVQVVLLPQAEE